MPYASVTVDAPSTTPLTTTGEEPEESEDDETVTGSVLQKGDRVPGMLDRVARSRPPNPRMISAQNRRSRSIGPAWPRTSGSPNKGPLCNG